ncbi:hypothetical protein [Herbaspirillum sp. YR522]|uniref:hypothetical protein n=1 Tax=Herbaspirillum sp. YR522 TaxID=1144342 RepID=UPI00026F7641|nr:hypothetical protein [Herbaspirillum sp. YR522]EJN09391.1 hypothetical protein PMI40_00839 [Herbaspirillum sp. YR522]
MKDELNSALMLIQEQGHQIAQLAQMIEWNVAVREAHDTLIQSLMPLVKDNPEFKRTLEMSYQARLGYHLRQDVSNSFIQNYSACVNALLPKSLRFDEVTPQMPTGKK